ncbi:MAG: caspase family protein [Myxococcales bacterium]
MGTALLLLLVVGTAAAGDPPPEPPSPSAHQVVSDRLNGGIYSLAFSPDGTMLATSAGITGTRIWDVARRAELRTFDRASQLKSMAWSASPSQLAVTGLGTQLMDVFEARLNPFLDAEGSPDNDAELVATTGDPAFPWVTVGYAGVIRYDKDLKPQPPLPGSPEQKIVMPKGLAASKDGTVIATATHEALFVWTKAATWTPRRVKLPLALQALALTPDGKLALVAAGEHTSGRVFAVDTGTGATVREFTLPDYERRVDLPGCLAVSKDGTLLAAGSLHHLAVWDVATGALRWDVNTDRLTAQSQHMLGSSNGIINHVAFSPTEPLLATGDGAGNLLLVDSSSGRLRGELGVRLRAPHRLFFTRDERALITVEGESVARWSTVTGERVIAEDAVAAADATELSSGEILYARSPITNSLVMPWESSGPCPKPGSPSEQVGEPIYLDHLGGSQAPPLSLADRGLVLEGPGKSAAPAPVAAPRAKRLANPVCVERAFSLLALDARHGQGLVRMTDPDGLSVVKFAGQTQVALEGAADFLFSPAFSSDGRLVVASNLKAARVWDSSTGKVVGEYSLEINGLKMADSAALSSDGKRLVIHAKPIGHSALALFEVASKKQQWAVSFNFTLGAVAFRGSSYDLLVGALDGSIGLMKDGKLVTAALGAKSLVAGIATSASGRLAATVHADGGVRLWGVEPFVWRASLLDYRDGEWLAATPGGAFIGTPEAASRTGWAFESPLEWFGMGQFASYRRPDVLKERLTGKANDLEPPKRRPPTVQILGHGARPGAASVKVRFSSEGTVKSVTAFLEGRAVATREVGAAQGELVVEVPLVSGLNHLALTSVDDAGLVSNPAELEVPSLGGARPSLWIVSVGVSRYPKLAPRYALKAADKDAQSLAAAFADQAGPGRLYDEIHTKVLLNEEGTVAAIRTALDDLSALRAGDLAIVFLAGHGLKRGANGDMVFLTSAATPADRYTTGTVGWREISERLAKVKGRVLLLLDACHSGHLTQEELAPNGELVSALSRDQRSGVLVFAAAKGRQRSYETDAHGHFTQALLDALAKPDTDRNRNGALELSELVDAVTVAVDSAMMGRQTPWVARREQFGDYTLFSRGAP